MFCRRLTNLFRLHATIFACSKICLCVIYVIVECRMLVLGIYDSDSDPDTLDCWLSFAYSSIHSVSEWSTSGSNPLKDKSCKPLYHYELFCHAVRMLLCLQQIYTFYLVATSQVFICSGEAMIDFLFQMSSFFSTTLRRCS